MVDQKKFLDYEGVKHLWSKINMQDYPNNETLMAVINAIDETKADRSELVQSDWDQNDETALDYVKNRTHYTEVVEESIVGIVYEIPTENCLYFGKIYTHNLHIPLQLGQTWTIQTAESYLGGTATCEVQLDDNGTPCLTFVKPLTFTSDSIIVGASWGDSQYLTGVTLTGVSGTYIVDTIVHQIPPKYVGTDWNINDPKTSGYIANRTHYEEEIHTDITGMEYVVPITDGTTASYGKEVTHNLNIPLELGQKWLCTQISSGTTERTSVECEVQQTDDGILYLGDLDPVNSPYAGFNIEVNTSIGNRSMIENNNYWDIKITGVSGVITTKTVHKLDPKYLPERNVFVTVSIDTDGNMTASHTSLEIYEAITSGSIVTLEYRRQHFSLVQCVPNRSLFECTYGLIGYSVNIILVDRNGVCTFTTTNIAPLDLVIPAPSTASIGQTLVVKAVDENGKPTEWETVETQPDWNQNDTSAPDFIKNKPDVVLRSEIEEIDAIELVTETGLVSPAAAEDGSIYTDENGALYSL